MGSINAPKAIALVAASLLIACNRQPSSALQDDIEMQLLGYVASKNGQNLARLKIRNATNNPIKFSGYQRSSEFEVADRFSDSYRVERGNNRWVSITPADTVDGIGPPFIFSVLPGSSTVVSVAAQKAPTEPYKICLTAVEPKIEICTEVLRQGNES